MFVPLFNVSIYCLFMLVIQSIDSATPKCVYELSKGQQLDIRTLGNKNGETPKYDNIANSNPTPLTFSWNGCFDYSKSDGGSCTKAAACATNKNTGQSNIIATQNSVTFEHHDDINFLTYNYNGMELTVSLVCRDSDKDSVNGRQDDANTYSIILQSRCCCPGKCQYSEDSLSGGAVFVIILLVLATVYIIGGVIFLRVTRGATGTELIPNRSLWLNILSYAIEGLRYSIQAIRHQSLSVEYQKM